MFTEMHLQAYYKKDLTLRFDPYANKLFSI
jgi:hypothetical protein